MVLREHGTFIEQRSSRIGQPLAQHNFQSIVPAQNKAAQVLVLIGIEKARSAVRGFKSLVTHIDAYDVPLLGEFEALFVRPLPVATDEGPPLRSAVVEASGAALHLVILGSQIGLATERGDHLVHQFACLPLISISTAGWSSALLSRKTRETQQN